MDGNAQLIICAAARAAWRTVLVAWGLTVLTWLASLAIGAGWLDGLISLGLYGEISRAELAKVTFWFAGALKLMCIGVLTGALFLGWWAQLLSRSSAKPG